MVDYNPVPAVRYVTLFFAHEASRENKKLAVHKLIRYEYKYSCHNVT